jgi:salicylate hydroxylase
MHRADLLCAQAKLPADRVHPNHRLVGLVDYGDRVAAEFATASTVDVDVLVGADGIHSPCARACWAAGGQLHRLRRLRGLVPADRLGHLGSR